MCVFESWQIGVKSVIYSSLSFQETQAWLWTSFSLNLAHQAASTGIIHREGASFNLQLGSGILHKRNEIGINPKTHCEFLLLSSNTEFKRFCIPGVISLSWSTGYKLGSLACCLRMYGFQLKWKRSIMPLHLQGKARVKVIKPHIYTYGY